MTDIVVRQGRYRTERGQRLRNAAAAIWVMIIVLFLGIFPFLILFRFSGIVFIIVLALPFVIGWAAWKKWSASINMKWGHMPLSSAMHPDDQPREWSVPRRYAQPESYRESHHWRKKKNHK